MRNKNNYHHGNLKLTMIEEGIEYINKHGIENMSLRKLASICNVSHSAPYKHFKDKDDFINQIIIYVTDKFMDSLNETSKKYKGTSDIMLELGITYVDFFARNKNYFNILFFENQIDFGVVFSRSKEEKNRESINSFPPYNLFENTATDFLKDQGVNEDEYNDQILFMWALVQGLASIYTLKGVEYKDAEKSSIRRILRIKGY